MEDQGTVRWDFAAINPPVYANSEACLVFINGKPSTASQHMVTQLTYLRLRERGFR